MISIPPSATAISPARYPDDADVTFDLLARALIDRIEIGLIACDETGTLLFANRSACSALRQQQPPRSLYDALEHAAASQARVRCAVAAAARAWASQLLTIRIDEHELSVVIMPLRMPSRQPIVMLMIGRTKFCSPLGLEMLAMSCGLTAAEKRVLAALVGDCSPRQIASMHGVALPTVRTQIQSIRDKLGARSVDALLRRVASVPPVSCILTEAGTR